MSTTEHTPAGLTERIVPRDLTRSADSALSRRIEQCKAEGRPALVGYLPAGYPTVEESAATARSPRCA